MQSHSSINLIKRKTSLSDEIVNWALSFGRLLIILVEIIAFSAFIYRFHLDRQSVDLNDKIKQEQEIVTATKSREDEYRNLQERIATVLMVSTTGSVYDKILNDIVAFTPPEITYNSFSVSGENLSMELNVTSISSLTSFIKSLQAYPKITSVTITAIDNSSSDNSVKVTMAAKLQGVSK